MIQLDEFDVWGLGAAVSAAVDTGLVAALADGRPRAGTALAAGLGLDPHAVERVLGVLAAVGVVEGGPAGWVLAPAVTEGHRAFPGGVAMTTALFSATPGWLRTGTTPFTMDGNTAERGEAYRGAVAGLGRLFARAAKAFAGALPGPVQRVVDVGCGSGVWSLALAEAHPTAAVTGIDLAPVLDVFLAEAEGRGLGARVRGRAGDMHDVPLPDADVVLLANVLRLEPPERARSLVARLAAAVAPGGRLVVIDALASGTPEREVSRAVYALHLALRTRDACVHTPDDVAGWMRDAGLSPVAPLDFGVFPGAVAACVGQRSAG